MKKRLLALALAAFMILPALASMPLTVSAAEVMPANTVAVDLALSAADGSAAEITVGKTTYGVIVGQTGFKTLSAALEKVPAGGTVLLAAGTYTEGVTIKKDVTILGPKAGINPNVPGAKPTDAWTRNPERGEGEAVLGTSWHMGINANSKEVFDCHNITIDGLAVKAGGMFRSNFGNEGYITINYKNILVSDYTQNNGNGPFYCTSYYPDKATNLYKRNINAENIRFEKQVGTPGFNLTIENFNAKGIYFDDNSTGEMFRLISISDTSKTKTAVNISITDSMFRQKINKILNCNLSETAQYTFNKDIGQREKVTVTIKNNYFVNNDCGAASNNNIIVPQVYTENVFFNITDNVFMQEGNVSANFIAIHGATGALPLGEKFVVTGNRFVNVPTALSMNKTTTAFDLSGNYFADGEGKPSKPVVVGLEKSEWWFMDYDMTQKSDVAGTVLDGVPTTGTVDKTNKTIKDTVTTDTYEFKIKTEKFNTLTVYTDKELKNAVSNPVKLYAETSTFYVKVASNDGKAYDVYTATITTSNPDKLTYDLATQVRFFGRTYNDNGTYFFNWSSSGFEFKFKGTGVKATIVSSAPGGGNTAYIKVYVDGVEKPDVALFNKSQEVVLAKDLDPNVEHTVKVVKRTNARSSSAGVSNLVLTDGEKLTPPAAPERLIEFIGDSIPVGYATVAGSLTTWSTATEDSTKTYSEQIAKAFGADYMVTAISGRGIVRNTGGDTDKLLPAIYPKLDEYNNPGVDYDFALQPDVIIINLGTNDASGNNPNLTSAEFRTGCKAFLKDVRKYTPNAEIIYAYGLMTTKFAGDMEAVVNELRAEGDAHISYIQLKSCSSTEKAIGHPTAEAYVSRGEKLIELIAEKTGWKAGEEPETTAPVETTKTPETTLAPETTVAPETTTAPTTEAPKGGCGSVLGIGTVVAATAAAAFVAKKKKED